MCICTHPPQIQKKKRKKKQCTKEKETKKSCSQPNLPKIQNNGKSQPQTIQKQFYIHLFFTTTLNPHPLEIMMFY